MVTLSGIDLQSDTSWAGWCLLCLFGSMTVIPAGVTLTFGSRRLSSSLPQDLSMTVNGTLTAVGTAGSPVVFTAYTDDSYGGDSNG